MTRRTSFPIRPATVNDASIVAHHRVGMFRDMGMLGPDTAEQLHQMSEAWLGPAIQRGEYRGWLASVDGRVVAGAGVQIRRVLPFPLTKDDGSVAVAEGRQAIVVNVYTEPEFRRRGLARALMEAVIAWAREADIESLVLHAARDGKALYEQLGFEQTNEMRYRGRN